MNPTIDQQFSLIIGEDAYRTWLTRYRTTDDPGTSVTMRLLNMALEREESFSELKHLLGDNGLNLVEDIRLYTQVIGPPRDNDTLGADQSFHMLRFRPSRGLGAGSGDFAYHQLSFGTRRVIRILTNLLFDRSTILLLEHPEDGIHRGLLRKLIGLLKTYTDPAQIFLASHSSVVFDKLRSNEVRWVTMKDGRSEVRALSDIEKNAAVQFIGEDGPPHNHRPYRFARRGVGRVRHYRRGSVRRGHAEGARPKTGRR